jgi:hypothetical protein
MDLGEKMRSLKRTRRMASSGILRRVALIRTDVSEELGDSCQPDH